MGLIIIMHNLKTSARVSVIAVLLASIMLLFTGCSKTAATTDSFKAVATEKNMEIADVIEQFSSYDYVKEATIAAPADRTYQIEFFVLSDASYARSFFDANKAKFELDKGNSFTEKSKDGKNFTTYTLTANDRYMFLEQVDSTVLYVDVEESCKNAVEDFIKKLKY